MSIKRLSEPHNVFIRDMRGSDEEEWTDHDIGSLYRKVDDYGRVFDLEIESYGEEQRDLFADLLPVLGDVDDVGRLLPLVFKRKVRRDGRARFRIGYAQDWPEMSEWGDVPRLGRRPSDLDLRAELEEEALLYARAIRGAQELWIRTLREEPALIVNWEGCPVLGEDGDLTTTVRVPAGRSREVPVLALGAEEAARAVALAWCRLEPVEEGSTEWPTLQLAIRLRGDGLPIGDGPVLGSAAVDRPSDGVWPLLVSRSGHVRSGKAAPKWLRDGWTNLFGRSVRPGGTICLWRSGFRESCGYRFAEVIGAPIASLADT